MVTQHKTKYNITKHLKDALFFYKSKVIAISIGYLFLPHLSAAEIDINFRNCSYNEVFEIAKNENKKVFLYFHFEGCAPCKRMETEVFTNRDVTTFFNTNFIAVKINTLVPEGKKIAAKYNISINPAFVFLDEATNELERAVGYFSSEDFLDIAQKANSIPLSLLREKYIKGNRSENFLYDYVDRLKIANELGLK